MPESFHLKRDNGGHTQSLSRVKPGLWTDHGVSRSPTVRLLGEAKPLLATRAPSSCSPRLFDSASRWVFFILFNHLGNLNLKLRNYPNGSNFSYQHCLQFSMFTYLLKCLPKLHWGVGTLKEFLRVSLLSVLFHCFLITCFCLSTEWYILRSSS